MLWFDESAPAGFCSFFCYQRRGTPRLPQSRPMFAFFPERPPLYDGAGEWRRGCRPPGDTEAPDAGTGRHAGQSVTGSSASHC
ncbi:hypothetical protein EYF80_042318 [Liparis tanakae]|uniref:Uncharacterized protein n=1 Tax=Liparis tanakae TaxID=230148 RepID=A0A4Z2G1R2_9TELE|nr:hypothetical protein EYF80_042318 [Liparis tanakae]